MILGSQQRFETQTHKVYTEEFNKIALIAKNDKRIQYLILQKQRHITKSDIKNEEINCNNIIKKFQKLLKLLFLHEKTKQNTM